MARTLKSLATGSRNLAPLTSPLALLGLKALAVIPLINLVSLFGLLRPFGLLRLVGVITLVGLVGLTGCTNPADAQRAENERIAREAADNVAKSKMSMDEYRDVAQAGQQPPPIHVSGLIVANGQLPSQITVEQLAGRSWRGERPATSPSRLEIDGKPRDPETSGLHEAKSRFDTYANFGCDLSGNSATDSTNAVVLRNAVNGLKAQTSRSDKSQQQLVHVNTAIVCALDGDVSYTIVADHVVLSGVNVTFKQSQIVRTLIQSDRLTLVGDNHLASRSPDADLTIAGGVEIGVSANQILGQGKLKITSEGSSYLAPKE